MKETRTICDVCRTETSEATEVALNWRDEPGPEGFSSIQVDDICPSCLARAQAALRPRERPSPRRKAKEGKADA